MKPTASMARGVAGAAAALAALLAMPLDARGQAAAWMDKAWPTRRLVTVAARRTPGAAGEEIGVVEVPTDGLARPDGGDLRVGSAAGRALPMMLLSVGPGSQARIAFEVQPGRNSYAIYYGQPKAPPRPDDLKLQLARGLLLETRTFAGGNLNTANGVQGAFERAKIHQGADFVPNVFLGHNLFGPAGRTISRYSGLLRIDKAGDYGFATSSDDASFLAIGGETIVGWGGYHGWVGDARHNNTVSLQPGLHRFEYLHVNVGRGGGAVAAWRPPGEKRWLPIPPEQFLPIYRGQFGERQRFGQPFAAEMTFANIGEALIGSDDYVQLYRLRSQPTGFDVGRATFEWDLGDGNRASGRGLTQVEHIYFRDGPADVTVTVSQGDHRDSVTNRVVISRNWRTVTRRRIDRPNDYALKASGYDFAKMHPVAVARAMKLFRRANAVKGYLSAGHALASSAEPVSNFLLERHLPEYADWLIERSATDGPPAAVKELTTAAARATSPFTQAAMHNAAARILLDVIGDDRRAEAEFNAALAHKDRGQHPAIRDAWIGLGDVHRRRGDGAKALAAYQQAEKMNPPISANLRAVRVGSLARSIEFYIRQKDFQTARDHLLEWDREFPTHKLGGYSTLQWVHFYQAQGKHREAIREAGDLVAASERSNYAAELLLASADSHLALKEPEKARRLLEHVINVYKDSPLVADAKEKLAAINP